MSEKRVAVIGGVRTPFVKAGTVFRDFGFHDLGEHVVRTMVKRYHVDVKQVGAFAFGSVLLDPRTPNWAREIVFRAGLPKSLYAYAVSNNCISGLVAITAVRDSIVTGAYDCGIAGGAESMSNPTLTFNRRSSKVFLNLIREKTFSAKAKALLGFRSFKDFLPEPPSITEPSTGLTMGEHMEITAKKFKISQKEQDEVAFRSHQRAAAATEDGRLTAEIEPLAGVTQDLLVRKDTSLEKLAKLRPVFDKSPLGTLTAGNSSALTDGASVVLLMSEERAKAEGRDILCYIRAYEYAAIDPAEGLLMAPGVCVPAMLKKLNLQLADFDLIEMHEAFGAQVVANLKSWKEGWKGPAIGDIDTAKLNALGGSIALGHPFSATGGRIVTTMANELKRRGAKRGLISICAAGAMAGAMVLERE